MTAQHRELPIPLEPIVRWLDAQAIPGEGMEAPCLLAGGTQNIVVRFERGGRPYVLRHPPANPRANSNRLIAREIRLLSALRGTDVPHPTLIAANVAAEGDTPTFYVMEAVAGFNPTLGLPPTLLDRADVRHRMGLEMIDGLAALAALDPVALGLADFGRLEGFLARQIERWVAELDSYHRFDAWEGPAALGDVAGVGAWLAEHCPRTMTPSIIHGDYHIGNAIFDEEGRMRAIVDWEMATLGDPLVDLGRLLVSWPDEGPAESHTMRVERLDGFPTRAELIERYGQRTGRSLDALPWFEVLACYKLGLILEGSHARAQAGLADPETGARLHRSAIALIARAQTLIGRPGPKHH